MSKRVCVVTGSRAEYGLLKPLLRETKKDRALKLQLVVTGMHLSSEFGLTYKEIEDDGFPIDEKVDIKLKSDTPSGIAASVGYGVRGFAEVYERLKPDMVVVLGDRFEILSSVIPAHLARIPVVHLHGGEVTQGAFDDAFRHAITKMSQLHFTSNESYRKRVIQLGEDPKRVYNVGAIGLDDISRLKFLSKTELEKNWQFQFGRYNLLITFHPVTLEENTSSEHFRQLLCALADLPETHFIFTKANADTHGKIINRMMDDYVKKNAQKAIAFASLGRLKYLSTMRLVDGVVGNSSSGVIEAPSFKIGTVDIGDRQKGRVCAKSIIHCHPNKKAIQRAIQKLYSKEFQKLLKKVVNPYQKNNTALHIKQIIKDFNIKTLKKEFFDIPFNKRS